MKKSDTYTARINTIKETLKQDKTLIPVIIGTKARSTIIAEDLNRKPTHILEILFPLTTINSKLHSELIIYLEKKDINYINLLLTKKTSLLIIQADQINNKLYISSVIADFTSLD